jgi:hypothetical protein
MLLSLFRCLLDGNDALGSDILGDRCSLPQIDSTLVGIEHLSGEPLQALKPTSEVASPDTIDAPALLHLVGLAGSSARRSFAVAVA